MKSTITWLFTLAALVALPGAWAQKQNIGNLIGLYDRLPECAKHCADQAIQSLTCDLFDHQCICESDMFERIGTHCVTGTCTVKESLHTMNLTTSLCDKPIRDRSGQYRAISNAFAIIAALFVVQRIGFKIYAKLDFGLDDWFTILALLISIPSTVINSAGLPKSGVGRDIWTLPFEKITEFGRFFYISVLIYFLEISVIKIALLFFYMRIFPSTEARRLLWGTIIMVALFGITFVLTSAFQCVPINYSWHMWDGEHEGQCMNLNAMMWSHAGISIALDGWMLAIPLWQIRGLHLDWKKKIGVALMFCVGTFVTVVSILRLHSLTKYNASIFNPTWDFVDIGIWSSVEIHVGIICICLPSLRLFLVHLFPKLLGTGSYFSDSKETGYNNASSGGARSRSRPGLVSGTVSRIERSQHRPEVGGNKIAVDTTYTVDYGDEMALVPMDKRSAISDNNSTIARSDL